MGNVLDTPKSGDVHNEDVNWLGIHHSAIFNEVYISSVYKDLPKFADTEIEKKSSEAKTLLLQYDIKITSLMEIFSKHHSGSVHIDDFESLNGSPSTDHSPFGLFNKMRSRLLQRIHLAILREAEFARKSGEFQNEQYLSVSEFCKVYEDANALLTASSVRMVIAFVKCLGPSNPELFRSMSETLLDLLTRSSVLALSKVESGSPQSETVQAIMNYAEDMATTNTGEDRGYALGLMFAVAVTSGSVRDLLSVANHLKCGVERLPSSAHTFMTRLRNIRTDLKLSVPSPHCTAGEFKSSIALEIPAHDSDPSPSVICTDGVYLYGWDRNSCSLFKTGSGFHGSIAGNQYMLNKDVEAQIRERLGDDVEDHHEEPVVEEKQGNAVAVPTGASEPLRRVRATRFTRMLDLGSHHIRELIENSISEDDIETQEVAPGFEGNILEEVTMELGGEQVLLYRLDETHWIVAQDDGEGEDEDEDDDDEEDSNSQMSADASDYDDGMDSSDEGSGFLLGGGRPSASATPRMGSRREDTRHAVEILGVPGLAGVGAAVGTLNSPRTAAGLSPATQAASEASAGNRKNGWLVCLQGRLYLRMKHLLGPHRVAIFSTTTLKLEEIVEVDIPVTELVKAKKLWTLNRQLADEDDESERDLLNQTIQTIEDEEGEAEWELGEEVNYGTVENGASIVAASSNFMVNGGQSERNLLVEPSGSETDPTRFLFADSDSSQYLILDLAQPRIVDKIGASFSIESADHAVQESFSVQVSPDGNQYFDWGSMHDPELKSPCVLHKREDFSALEEIRYVRFEFGRNVDNASGSAVTRLLVFGRPKVKKQTPVPFPILVSDGRHLVFLHAARISSGASGQKDNFLQSFSVDPFVDSTVWTTVSYDIVLREAQMQQCAFCCNSEKLIVSHRKDFAKRSSKDGDVDFVYSKLDMITGKQLGVSEVTFPKGKGVPYGLSYDHRNNMIWGWDCYLQIVTRWRNDGLAPRFGPARAIPEADLLLSISPTHRLRALENVPGLVMNSEAEAALILCQLDRLAELYSSPLLPAAESRTADEVEVMAAGYEDPSGCVCKLLVRGQNYGTNLRGFNLLVLNDQYVPGEARNFDTHDSTSASERMADFIDGIPEGSVVLVGTMDSAVGKLTARAMAGLASLGAEHLEKLQFRGSFAMVGRKGAGIGKVPQSMAEKKKGPVTVRIRLPTPRVPLAVEATAETVTMLVRLISIHYASLEADAASKFEKVMLISSLHLLTTNVFQLLRGSPIPLATEIFNSQDRQLVMKIVTGLIAKPPKTEGGDAIADGALRLFITSIDVLYPTAGEKCALLVRYLNEFVKDGLSSLERSVLELLLRQMSDPSALMRLWNGVGDDNNVVVDPFSLVTSMLSIAKKETVLRLRAMKNGTETTSSISAADSNGHHVGVAAVQMLATLCNLILCQSSHATVTATVDAEGRLSDDRGKVIVQMVNELMEVGADIIECAIEVNSVLIGNKPKNAATEDLQSLDVEIDEILKDSPVGAILPTVGASVSLLLRGHGSKLIRCGLEDITSNLCKLVSTVQDLVDILPREALSPKTTTDGGITMSSAVFESEHPYASNTDQLIEMSFKGASRITIVFDEKTKTENNYDYVRFYKESSKNETWHPAIDKFTGRNGSENWPGFGNRPPLVIDGDCAWIEFHSDGSNEDWGWKLTATAEFKRQPSSQQAHWVIEMERQLAQCGALSASSLIVSVPWESPLEDRNAVWMEDNLFESGFESESLLEDLSEEDQFLFGIVDFHTQDSVGAQFIAKMKGRVSEDRGQVEQINRAVYSTCAALIKHNKLVNEAMAVANGSLQKIPEPLVAVWRAGQKMRQYFEGGDIRSATAQHQPASVDDAGVLAAAPAIPVLRRGSSSMESVRHTADEVVRRARFLLRVHHIPTKDFEDKSAKAASKARKLEAGLSQVQSPYGPTMSKEGEGLGENDSQGSERLNELLRKRKLKGKLAGRRRSAQSQSMHVKKSLTSEKVIRFVQSNHNVEQLERLRDKRNVRARYRVKGYEMLEGLLKVVRSPFSLSLLLSAYSTALRTTKRADRPRARTHFMNAIEGCSSSEQALMVAMFSRFLSSCVHKVESAFDALVDLKKTKKERAEWEEVVVNGLAACSMDYDLSDHDMLDRAGILMMLEKLVSSDSPRVRGTTWNLFEILSLRSATPEYVKNDLLEELSTFSAKTASLLVKGLSSTAAGTTQREGGSSGSLPAHSGGFKEIVRQPICISSDSLGFAFPHESIGLQHSFSLWVRRAPTETEESLLSSRLSEGQLVCRGPTWKLENEDGGPESTGTVTRVDVEGESPQVEVLWGNGSKKSYAYQLSGENQASCEVVPCDEELGGFLYYKGAPAIMAGDGSPTVWSFFGLKLLKSAHVAAVIGGFEDQVFYNSSKTQLTTEWTHIAVVQDKAKSRLFVNGVLESEKTLESHLLNPGKANKSVIVVESPHPYRDNSEDYVVVEKPGALSFTITFDPQTKTEANYDYVRFYKDDSHSDYWGEEKYTGGRGGSAMNWPGLSAKAPLRIPASRFVVYFKSDGSNNDWGYRIFCTAEVPVELTDSDIPTNPLNFMPLYIGQMPTYASAERSATVALTDMKLFFQPLSPEEIEGLVASKPTPPTSGTSDVTPSLAAIALMQKLSPTLSSYCGSTPLEDSILLSGAVFKALFQLMGGAADVEIACLRLCASLFPFSTPEVVDEQAQLFGYAVDGSFVGFLVAQIGKEMNIWTTYARQHSMRAQLLYCAEVRFAILKERLLLLRSLAVSENWAEVVGGAVADSVSRVASSLARVQELARLEPERGCSDKDVSSAEAELIPLFTVLGLFGGALDGLYVGARATYLLGDDNTVPEPCVILAPTVPPTIARDDKTGESTWRGLKSFGEAFDIVVDSQPGVVLTVPRHKLVPDKQFVLSPSMDDFLREHASSLVECFQLVASIDCVDHRPLYLPKIVESDECSTFESSHPYVDNLEQYTTIKFPGAKKIVIEFDSQSRTEPNCDFIRFCKDVGRSSYWGLEKYSGRDLEANWPGTGGRPPLVIPAESCVLYFHSIGVSSSLRRRIA